ncbi:hypothetical protein AZH51_09815 [Branchiibius sp. NY16-3462-2]|nr:hypothetical protein AZH51_09815 [Branchiibius sp. NY16-3462-2]
MDAPVRARRIAEALASPPPTPEQERIIEADPLAPLVVVAGAGSGKTETMAMRVLWLVANRHVTPDEVLGLTFTRKAAAELGHRLQLRLRRLDVAGLLPRATQDDVAAALAAPTVQTYHSYAARLVGEQGLRLGIEPDTELLSEAAAWQLASQVVQSYDGPMDAVELAPSTVTKAVIALSGELAEHLLPIAEMDTYLGDFESHLRTLAKSGRMTKIPGGLDGHSAKLRQLLPVVTAYQRAKHERVAMDYGDQVAIAAQVAMRFPQLGRAERSRYRAVLLDEFQDTSEAQMRLLESLWVTADEPVVVTAVGDPHQSIYGWRGASARTLDDFPRRFAGPGPQAPVPADQAQLSISWRNDRSILAVANRIAKPLAAQGDLDVAQLSAGPAADDGEVLIGRYSTLDAEAAQIAEWLKQRRLNLPDPSTFSAAVLCRKRSLFVPVAAALEVAGVPYELVGVGGLLTMAEVGDVVSLLWTVHDPSRGDRLMRLLSGSALRLGAADLDALGVWSRHLVPRGSGSGDLAPDTAERASIVETLEHLPAPDWVGPSGESLSAEGLARLDRLAHVVRRLRRLNNLPLGDLAVEAIHSLGLDVEVAARPEYDTGSGAAALDAFLDVAARYAGSAGRATLGSFLEWLEAAETEEDGLDAPVVQAAPGVVQVLTIHAAKGLEWDDVAVAGLGEGVFPAHSGWATWNPEWAGWALGKDAVPHDPGTWVTADSGWTSGVRIPFDLRGDVTGLPALNWAQVDTYKDLKEQLEEFRAAYGAHELAAERRLAYVAVTRAKHALFLTSSVWGTAKRPRLPSRFLLEARDLIEQGDVPGGRIVHWEPLPPEEAENPLLEQPRQASWPPPQVDSPSIESLRAAAGQVEQLREQLEHDQLSWRAWSSTLSPQLRDDLTALLAERDRAGSNGSTSVELPSHLSASQIVALARDPQEFARALRRPMPVRPQPAARQGTAFHAWIEKHYQSAALVDVDQLPGVDDDDADHFADLAQLKETFLASEWADRQPLEIEVPVETWIGTASIRGRIDAVFPAVAGSSVPDGGPTGVVIVDWKTGSQPHGQEAATRALQLAAYRLAYARLRGVAPSQVAAAFYYAATGTTVYPDLPPDDAIEQLLAEAVSS